MKIFFRYIYGNISLDLNIFIILEATNELSLQELITYLQNYLIEN